MIPGEIHVVTGAFGFSGKYIAKRLLDAGYEVQTLTNSPERTNPFGGKVKAYLYSFDNHKNLVESLKGTSVLYNNYWVRFNHPDFTYSMAVENTLKLFDAAKKLELEDKKISNSPPVGQTRLTEWARDKK